MHKKRAFTDYGKEKGKRVAVRTPKVKGLGRVHKELGSDSPPPKRYHYGTLQRIDKTSWNPYGHGYICLRERCAKTHETYSRFYPGTDDNVDFFALLQSKFFSVSSSSSATTNTCPFSVLERHYKRDEIVVLLKEEINKTLPAYAIVDKFYSNEDLKRLENLEGTLETYFQHFEFAGIPFVLRDKITFENPW